MNKTKIVLPLLAALLLVALPATDASAINNYDDCKRAIGVIVDRTTVGNPPVRIGGGGRRRQVVRSVQNAVENGLTSEQAYNQAMSRLRMIRNQYFRRDIAQGYANLVGQAGQLNECK